MTRVSAGLCFQGDRVWIFRRGEGRRNAHLWEFPGGKEEAGEDPAACLVRELQEELSLSVTPPAVYAEEDWEGIHFTFLRCEALNEPRLTEHEGCALAAPRDLLAYDFCPADRPVAQRLALTEPPLCSFFWDLDGTVLDTYAAMVPCFCGVLAAHRVQAEPGRVLSMMKDSLGVCVQTYAAENGLSPEELFRAFAAAEQELPLSRIRPMPGVPELLAALAKRGARHYLVTHRDGLAFRYLDACGLRDAFTDIVTGLDSFPRKPAPDSLRFLVKKHGLDPARCIMVGDRPLDVDAGRNAGMAGCLIDPEGRFADHACTLHVASAAELAQLLLADG